MNRERDQETSVEIEIYCHKSCGQSDSLEFSAKPVLSYMPLVHGCLENEVCSDLRTLHGVN